MADRSTREPWSWAEFKAVRKQVRSLNRDRRHDLNRALLRGRAVKDPGLAVLAVRAADISGWRRGSPLPWILILATVLWLLPPAMRAITSHDLFGLEALLPVVVLGLAATVVATRQARRSAAANRQLLRTMTPT